ncbi:MAG: TerC/Alx family metal homeostasis membrane protein [Chthoniobacteraceae bacterium]
MINETLFLWGGFILFILAMLALDLGVFQRKAHVISMREALIWFGVWIGLALVFNILVVLFHERGGQAGLEFFTGFLVEKSLSVDNIFVFLLIFNYFRVPPTYQHKVLFWGVVGAIILRILFIVAGLALLERFHWMIYVFGSFLLFTGISMVRNKEVAVDPGHNWLITLFRRFAPVSERYDGDRFFSRIDGRKVATPLFVVLLAIESSDIIFAADSIPAIFAITEDPFIVFTSNIFAMLGLRALYFAVAGFMGMFHFLHYGFASIILILGVKMLLSEFYKIPIALSLALILVILLVCVIISLLRPRRADLKMMFERTEKLGLMPFRRLLLIENIVDLGEISVRDSMRHRSGVRSIRLDLSWEENLRMLRETRYSRYPVVETADVKPLGIIHLKDLVLEYGAPEPDSTIFRKLARPCLELREELPLDDALTLFQRGYIHMAVVTDAQNKWTGIITFEDVLEELVGNIGDEFDTARTGPIVSLADAMSASRVVFGLQANSISEAIEKLIMQVPVRELPDDPKMIVACVLQREATMTTYLGHGLALPHCRLDSIERPLLFFARSEEGIPQENSNERIELIFLLLTPSRMARIQPRLLADIVGLVESDYVTERMKQATEPEEVIGAVRDGQQVVLD